MRIVHIWKRGPLRDAAGPLYVSVTEFRYRRMSVMPRVAWNALRLRRGWPAREGAVALRTAGKATEPVSISLSVWRSKDDLRRFLRSPEHVELVRRFRPHLVESRSFDFTTGDRPGRGIWARGMSLLDGDDAAGMDARPAG